MNSASPMTGEATPLALAVLSEIATALARLAETGEETTIDLKSLPLSPDDLARLGELLGEVAGRSEVRETGFSGVWWIRHLGLGDEVALEEIAITFVPEILHAHPDDVARAARRLAEAVTAPLADEEETPRG